MAQDDPVERAVGLIKAGNKQDARAILKDVLQQDNRNVRAWASLYSTSKDAEEAAFFLQQVLRLRPGNEWALERLSRLEKEATTKQPIAAPSSALHGQQSIQQSGPSDALVAAAQMKDFTSSAILTFFLYLLFFIPGLIFNIMYLREAERVQRLAGRKPTGMGCLQLLLIVNLGVLMIVFIVLCVLPVFGVALIGGT